MMKEKLDNHKIFWFCTAFFITLTIRFIVKNQTYADLDAWFNAGKIVTSGGNIYAETNAYNYGPVFSMIIGILYRIALLFADNYSAFRGLVIVMLTLTDLAIALLIANRAGNLWGLIFLFAPQSVWASSRNYQFDNIAVLLGMCGVLCLEESSQENSFSMSDLYGTIFLSMSLIMKHVLWMFPLWILFSTKINTRKKILYAFVPPVLFLLSFAPYWDEGSQGIIRNVFMYRSANNFPLFAVGMLNQFGIFLPLQRHLCFMLFGVLMVIVAYIFRREGIYKLFLIYTIAQVCFSSGIVSQYFVIPIPALILLFREWSLIYFVMGTVIRLSISRIIQTINNPLYARNLMFTPMTWCLLAYLVYYYFSSKREN